MSAISYYSSELSASSPVIRRLHVPPFDRLEPFLPRPGGADRETRDQVLHILEAVRSRGDEAVREYTWAFDRVDLAPAEWELKPDAWQGALDRTPKRLREALDLAVDRVRTYHERQREPGFRVTEPDGTLLGMKVTPLDRVGLYVPGGKASYPQSVIMNAVPAVVAGVQEIVAVVPPGGVTDTVLAACALAGVTRIFRVGGAQAVAALAYGTATVPRVDKIVGPGNRWVAEAKRQVVGQVGIDMIAGPTELLVIADDSARPERVAADLVAQAEHDEDACAWCVTCDEVLADALPEALESALARAPRAAIARASLERNGLVVVVPTLREADRGRQPAGAGAPGDRRGRGRRSRRPSATPAPSSWGTTPPSRWATTSPGRATSSPPAAPRATRRRSASTTSSSARASSTTAPAGWPPMRRPSSRWRRPRGCSATPRRCESGPHASFRV